MYIYISRVLQLNLWKNGMGQLNHARASSSAVGQLNLPQVEEACEINK